MLNPTYSSGVTWQVCTSSRREKRRKARARLHCAIEPLEHRQLLSVIYVDCIDHNGDAVNDGSSWFNACVGLQVGLAAASSGDEIRVADGTYYPTTGTDRAATFQLKNGVSILGGFAGHGAADPDARDVALAPSILSGNIGSAGSKYDNSYHVVVGTNTDGTAVLDGFTITKGKSNLSGEGGGMYIKDGSPTVRNCLVTGNEGIYGGGLYCTNGSPGISDCQFIGNYATTCGGVYNAANSSPTYSGCTFKENWADGGGGGMHNSDSSPTVVNCTFSNNDGHNQGGGMYNGGTGSKPIVTDCTFFGNTANGGAGMYCNTATPTVTNCYFIANTGLSGGAMATSACKPFSVTNCVFVGNYARDAGGAAYHNTNWANSPVFTNCTFSGNKSDVGGAIYNYSGYTHVLLRNCVLWGNTATSYSQYRNAGGSSMEITACDIQGATPGVGLIADNPLFFRDPSIGADGLWSTSDDDYGDLRLQAASPCVDIASNTLAVGITTDILGQDRFVDVPGVNDPGAIVDMGAYEANPTTVTAGDRFYLRLNLDRSTLHLWRAAEPAGAPDETFAVSELHGLILPGTAADSALFVDLSNGSTIPGGVLFNAGDGKDCLSIITPVAGENMDVRPRLLLAGSAAIISNSVESICVDGAPGSELQINRLDISSPLAVAGDKDLAIRANSLNLADPASLDLADADMILEYSGPSPIQTVCQWLCKGRIGATPSLLTSHAWAWPAGTAALGVVDNALLHLGSFAGHTLSPGFGQVLVKYTCLGDTNLDGVVTSADYLNVIANMGKTSTQWFLGDLDHSGTVTVDDLSLVTLYLASAASSVTGPLPPTLSQSAVPSTSVRPKAKSTTRATARAAKVRCLRKSVGSRAHA